MKTFQPSVYLFFFLDTIQVLSGLSFAFGEETEVDSGAKALQVKPEDRSLYIRAAGHVIGASERHNYHILTSLITAVLLVVAVSGLLYDRYVMTAEYSI